jgi:Family of unknown function (DUF5678)
MLEKEFQYFVDNQHALFKQFPDQYIAIKDQKVVGVYDTKIDAYFETEKDHEIGSFLIQFCTLDQETFNQNFGTNSMIA